MDVEMISVNRARSLIAEEKSKGKRPKTKSPVIEQYEALLKGLGRRRSLLLTLGENDKFPTVKYRLNSAARCLGITNLKIERAGNKVVVYRIPKKAVRTSVASRVRQMETTAPSATRFERKRASEALVEPAEVPDETTYREFELQGTSSEGTEQAFDQPLGEETEERQMAQTLDEVPEDGLPGTCEDELFFDEEWQELMLRGRKTCTTLTKQYEGKTFQAFGDEYFVTKVEQMELGEVAQKRFREHGCYSPKEFRELWKMHHERSFDPEQKVWVHHFKKAFEVPEGGG